MPFCITYLNDICVLNVGFKKFETSLENQEMDAEDFVTAAGQLASLVADYHTNLPNKKRVTVFKREGFLTADPPYGEGLPSEPPQHGEKWEQIYRDIDRVIIENVRHINDINNAFRFSLKL